MQTLATEMFGRRDAFVDVIGNTATAILGKDTRPFTADSFVQKHRPGAAQEVSIYEPPPLSERPGLIDALRIAGSRLREPAERAFLTYTGLQLIHPLPEGNGRTGRFLHDRIAANLPFSTTDIGASVATHPPADALDFEKRVTHPSVTIDWVARLAILPDRLGEHAYGINSISVPDLDSGDLTAVETLVSRIPGLNSGEVESLFRYLTASHAGLSAFKLVWIGFQDNVPTVQLPNNMLDIHLEGFNDVLRNFNAAAARVLLGQCGAMSCRMVKELIRVFAEPTAFPRIPLDNGTDVLFKDFLMGLAGSQRR